MFSACNLTDRTVTILGASVSCGCVSTIDRLPVVIAPKSTKELHVKLVFQDSPTGVLEQTVIYHTDHPSAPRLGAKLVGSLFRR